MLQTDKKKIPVNLLPIGWLKQAHQDLGYSESLIRKVAQGRKENILVFEYLITKVEQVKAKKTELEKRLTKINS